MVRQGKGKKDRVVPIGERALMWLQKYLDTVRPEFLRPGDEGFLFLAQDGKVLHKVTLTARVRRYVQAAATGKEGACHMLRHTAATLMLEGGADVRYVQQLLGHSKLETTQIYTQVSITKLKEVHDATHPGANLAGPPPKPA
jgi:integrase/recombinase XerD